MSSNDNIDNNETINETNNSNIELKLGDIIEINSPTNPQYHQNVYYIDYIDANKIVIINVSTTQLIANITTTIAIINPTL